MRLFFCGKEQMKMKLVLAEKPSVAQSIVSVKQNTPILVDDLMR